MQKIIEQKEKAGFSAKNTLLAHYFPQYAHLTLVQFIVLAFVGSIVITLGAKINIPLYPVHTTMQMFAVMLLGCVFGSRLALASVVAYLAEAFCGLPVLMGVIAGPAAFVGPTAGYLFGFMITAYSVGFLYERGFGRTFYPPSFCFLWVPLLLISQVLLGFTT